MFSYLNVILGQILYPGYENAAVEDWRGVTEHISNGCSDDEEGRPVSEVVAGAADGGAAGRDVEAGGVDIDALIWPRAGG